MIQPDESIGQHENEGEQQGIAENIQVKCGFPDRDAPFHGRIAAACKENPKHDGNRDGIKHTLIAVIAAVKYNHTLSLHYCPWSRAP
ncbi:hypothetical protein [Bifidobacterium actinocoloniiforme]|uniref:hypothetical protein n=1 Tax=Bifidobacterium actinocoloniiforme TaxID=638619 RepID=UPI0011874767|nr:hypothetical protein [Bifidobacterium actinocoloniiforme]